MPGRGRRERKTLWRKIDGNEKSAIISHTQIVKRSGDGWEDRKGCLGVCLRKVSSSMVGHMLDMQKTPRFTSWHFKWKGDDQERDRLASLRPWRGISSLSRHSLYSIDSQVIWLNIRQLHVFFTCHGLDPKRIPFMPSPHHFDCTLSFTLKSLPGESEDRHCRMSSDKLQR